MLIRIIKKVVTDGGKTMHIEERVVKDGGATQTLIHDIPMSQYHPAKMMALRQKALGLKATGERANKGVTKLGGKKK